MCSMGCGHVSVVMITHGAGSGFNRKHAVRLLMVQEDGQTWLPVYKTGVRRDNLNPVW